MLESLFDKVAGLIKDSQYKCFSVNIAKFLETSILEDMCERLLLYFLVFVHVLRDRATFESVKSVYLTDHNMKVYK